jgi:16S rRNA (uracil1498-N3)-methyltransferase
MGSYIFELPIANTKSTKAMPENLFFCPDITLNSQLSEQESLHCTRVLRMKEGDTLTVTDGKGTFYRCTLIQAHTKRSIVQIDEQIELPKSWNFDLHIAFAPTKNMDRNEWFLEKATEIGTDRFTPLFCRFSERKEIKTERLEKIAVSAMKQSQQASLPTVDEMTPFDLFIAQPFSGQKFIAHCYNQEKTPLAQLYTKGENALILIGPEGDFSEEEVEKAIQNGFQSVTLGENRLRTETACLAAVHTIHVINHL